MITLDQRVTLYVPDRGLPKTDSSRRRPVRTALQFLSGLFGGATVESATNGAYVNPTQGLITEKITRVNSYTDQATLLARLADVQAFAGKLAAELGQECVALEVNTTMYLIACEDAADS